MTEENNGTPEGVSEDTAAALNAEQADQTNQSGDDAAAAADESGGQQPKPKKSAQERIDELTRARREAEREAEFWRAKATQAPAPQQPTQAAAPDDGEPHPDDYTHGENDLAYVRDLARYEARQEFVRQAEQERRRSTVQSKLSTFEGKAEELFPDGEPQGLKAFRALPEVPDGIAEVILASDIGPKIAAHLGDNPRELRRISGLSPALQARELTLLETRLTAPPKPTPKTVTDAPEPAPQARGAGGRFTVAPDTDDFAAFEKQYGS